MLGTSSIDILLFVVTRHALVTGSAYGDVCPSGSYCPEGTDEPLDCPQGSYNPDEGRSDISECLDCTGGSYCDVTGMSPPVTGLCLRQSLTFVSLSHRPLSLLVTDVCLCQSQTCVTVSHGPVSPPVIDLCLCQSQTVSHEVV